MENRQKEIDKLKDFIWDEKLYGNILCEGAQGFWLDININILINRLKKSKKRPLLFKKNINEAIGKIYFERKKIYSEADFKVRCDKLKTDTIVNKILKIYENA